MAKDPYRYFRIEAQELLEGLAQGLLELEKGPDAELVRRLLRQAHTFKGASRVVKRTDIGDLAHQLEDVLAPQRDSDDPVESETIDRALVLLDQIRGLVASLGADAAVGTELARPRAEVEADLRAIRVAVRDLDGLLETAFEAHTAAWSLQREAARLDGIRDQTRDLVAELDSNRGPRSTAAFSADVERIAVDLGAAQRRIVEQTERVLKELAELRAAASDLRLVPAQLLMTDLERVVRDAARTLDKEVEVHATGAQTQLDAHVLAALRNALVHVVRNSVAHGIEDRATRVRNGKLPTGRIDIAIERRGHRVAIRCRDDGRGLDLELVRRAAIESGLVSPDEARAIDGRALGELLLRGGLSTSATVTGVSGRGVGLDAVRDTVEALEGEITLHSSPGGGTTVEILVPLSLSAIPTLSMQVDDTAVLVPLDSVRQALRVSPTEISRDGECERIVVDGGVVPFLPLRRVLGRSGVEQTVAQSAVLIEAGGRRAVIAVDRVGVARNIVVRSVPEHAAADAIVSGAALDDLGVPQLVLAPAALIRAASAPVSAHSEPAAREIPPLLVIDDSLTTRMLEQSILESAGYEVDLAISGEEALEKARRRKYGAFIVDVEMPGMDGFEFIASVRADPDLRETPAILVTSRADTRDKRRGEEVGAQAYIVKSEFDQAQLLASIERLIR